MVRFLLLVLLFLAPPALAGSRAESLLLAGRVEEALPVAKAEAEAAPGDLAAHERYIDILLSVGLPGVAVDTYRARAEAELDADSLYLFGRAVLTAEEAEALYAKALELEPGHARSYMGLGAVFRALGRYEDAAVAYQRALEIDSKLGEAWAGLGSALIAQGRVDDGLEVARLGMVNVPGEGDSYLAVSILAPAEAESVLHLAVANVPSDPRVHAALAESLLEVGDGTGAKTASEAALAINPGRADARLSLLFALAMTEGVLDAEGYRGLIEARSLEEMGPKLAVTAYDGLVEAYPKCALTYMGRARIRSVGGDTKGAIEDLSKAVALDPSNVEAMAALGMVLLDGGRVSEARPLLDRAHTDRPYDASLLVAAAMARAGAGDKEGSTKLLAEGVEIHPYDARVVLTYSKVLAESGESHKAYELLSAAVERIPGDERIVLSLAAAAKDVGRIEEAAIWLESLADRTGNEAWRDLARRLRSGELGGG